MTETKRINLKPLFGTRPESYFGDKREFCQIIISKLGLGGDPSSAETADPEEVIKHYTMEAILQFAFEKDLAVEELIPLPLELQSEDLDCLFAQAASEGVQTFEIDGDPPPREAVAQVLLRFKALEVVCAPVPQWSPAKREFMNQVRGKLEKFLHHD